MKIEKNRQMIIDESEDIDEYKHKKGNSCEI